MPLIKKSNHHLLFKSWKNGQEMFKDKFNILTPINGKFSTPNIMLIPLLSFDKKKIDWVMAEDFMIEPFHI